MSSCGGWLANMWGLASGPYKRWSDWQIGTLMVSGTLTRRDNPHQTNEHNTIILDMKSRQPSLLLGGAVTDISGYKTTVQGSKRSNPSIDGISHEKRRRLGSPGTARVTSYVEPVGTRGNPWDDPTRSAPQTLPRSSSSASAGLQRPQLWHHDTIWTGGFVMVCPNTRYILSVHPQSCKLLSW